MSAIRVKKLNEHAILPTYGSEEAAGADLYACLDETITVAPGQTVWIPTGLAMEIPKGCAGLVYARSGLACKRGLAPANKVGVIDSDYRGPVTVVLYNHSDTAQTDRETVTRKDGADDTDGAAAEFGAYILGDVVHRRIVTLCACDDRLGDRNNVAVTECKAVTFSGSKNTVCYDLCKIITFTDDGTADTSGNSTD